jgi:glutathione-specific gamma-glutamylcyclotransferase
MSGMRRPLAVDFVKCKRLDITTKGVDFTSLRAAILVAVPPMSAITLHDSEFPTGDLWVFGYGSLIWRPGFDFVERVPARLIGEHRALCVYSFVHRGTPEKPGLVLGLDRGGACRGIAFRIAEKNRSATVAYLREREQVTSVYREVKRSVWLENEARQRVSALAYVVDRGHVQYAGRLTLADQLRHVLQGHGQSGINRDYVLATVKAIEAEGFRDQQLHQLAMMLHGEHVVPLRDGDKDR